MTGIIPQNTFSTLLFCTFTLISYFTQSSASLRKAETAAEEILDKDAQRNDLSILNSEGTLNLLNNYRKRHGVPALDYDVVLGQSAAKWAKRVHDKVILLGKMVPLYSHPHIEGENVFVTSGGSGSGVGVAVTVAASAIHHWYCEMATYDFAGNQFAFRTAQFSQLVWKRTRRLGMAAMHDPIRNFTVVVARFKPPGNVGFTLSFRENVAPPDPSITPNDFPPCKKVPQTMAEPSTLTNSSTSDLSTSAAVKNRSENGSNAGIHTPSMAMSRVSDSNSMIARDSAAGQETVTSVQKLGHNTPVPQNDISRTIRKSNGTAAEQDWNSTLTKSKTSLKRFQTQDEVVDTKTVTSSREKGRSLSLSPTKIHHGLVENGQQMQFRVNTDFGMWDNEDKNIPHGISVVKVPDGSSEVYAVHRLDDDVHAKGRLDVQELHRVKYKKTSTPVENKPNR